MMKPQLSHAKTLIPLTGQTDYTVREGDTLADILRVSGVSIQDIATRNPRCNLLDLHPGQTLRLPKHRPSGRAYRVRRGENVYSLARKFGSSVAALLKINPHLRPSEICPGVYISLPEE